jgi:hypothetical protein
LSAFIRVYWWFKKKETGGLDGNAELLNWKLLNLFTFEMVTDLSSVAEHSSNGD